MNVFNPPGLEQYGLLRSRLVVSVRVDALLAKDTNPQQEVDKSRDDCGYDWCDGPTSTTLPCFECFDPNRKYETGTNLSVVERTTRREADQ